MPRFLDEGQEPLQRCYKKGDILKLLPFQGDRRADKTWETPGRVDKA